MPNRTVNVLHKTVATRRGPLTVFVNDTGAVTTSLVNYGEWAENELAFMEKLASANDTIVDVGAYIGTHTLAFSQLVGPAGKVIAIEPQPETFRLLEENVEANGLANVALFQAAAGERAGTIEIPSVDPTRGANFGAASLVAATESRSELSRSAKLTPVQVITIDSLKLDRCALIKIDAEGLEHEIIRGAEETIGRLGPAIYAECNTVDGGIKTVALLRGLGYETRLHLVNAFNPKNFNCNEVDIFMGAREAAVIGLRRIAIDVLEAALRAPNELLLKLDTADDLVLGMLNKPQYPHEVLSNSAAARTGGAVWLASQQDLRAGLNRSGWDANPDFDDHDRQRTS